MLVVDRATGRVVRGYNNVGDTTGAGAAWGGLLWLGGGEGDPSILGVGVDCTNSCVAELTAIGKGIWIDPGGDLPTSAALREGVVLISTDLGTDRDPTWLDVYRDRGHDRPIDLPQMPRSAPFEIVADVARDRLFVISSAGVVAEVDHVAKRPSISYHTVELNGKPFDATWAGGSKIALWGEDGLGTIDTRTWTTEAVAANVTGAVATPMGLAAWTADPADGLTVYRSDGSKRFQVLIGTPIRTVQALGDFLYVDAGRYSVDLRTGKVFGPTQRRTMVVTPTFTPIP
jgi:hypothetical protein